MKIAEALKLVRGIAPDYVDQNTAGLAETVRMEMTGWMSVHDMMTGNDNIYHQCAMLVAELSRPDGIRHQIAFRLLAKIGEAVKRANQLAFIEKVPQLHFYRHGRS